MSLKAGRVGVNPADVDPINGHIVPDSVDSYTKVQADARFQPMNLAVPIKYLNGSVLGTFNTVQEALSGSYGEDGAMTNRELTDAVNRNVWSSAINVDLSGTELNGKGSLKISENIGSHLIFLSWEGNGTAPTAQDNFINISSLIHEDIVYTQGCVMYNGSYFGVNGYDSSVANRNRVNVKTSTATWSKACLMIPTQPRT